MVPPPFLDPRAFRQMQERRGCGTATQAMTLA